MTPFPMFVRASRLYDVQEAERIQMDWTNGQPLRESQDEIEAAVEEIEA